MIRLITALFFITTSLPSIANTVASVDDLKISDRLFSLYANKMFGDSYFIVNNSEMKKKALSSLIDEILLTKALKKKTRVNVSINEDLKILKLLSEKDLYTQVFQSEKGKSSTKVGVAKKERLVSYYKVLAKSKREAAEFMKILNARFEKTKSKRAHGKIFLSFGREVNPKSFVSSKTFLSSENLATELDKQIIAATDHGLLTDPIESDFGYNIVFINRIYTDREIEVFNSKYNESENLKADLEQLIKSQKQQSSIKIFEKNLEKLNVLDKNF